MDRYCPLPAHDPHDRSLLCTYGPERLTPGGVWKWGGAAVVLWTVVSLLFRGDPPEDLMEEPDDYAGMDEPKDYDEAAEAKPFLVRVFNTLLTRDMQLVSDRVPCPAGRFTRRRTQIWMQETRNLGSALVRSIVRRLTPPAPVEHRLKLLNGRLSRVMDGGTSVFEWVFPPTLEYLDDLEVWTHTCSSVF